MTADIDALEGVIDECVSNLDVSQIPEAIVTEIPVLYENAEDIEEIAAIEHKSIEEIIQIHSQSLYYIYTCLALHPDTHTQHGLKTPSTSNAETPHE